jgi:hypothetical protein
MNHPAELALHQYLEDAANGRSTISDEIVDQIAKDVADAVKRQFGSASRKDKFRFRMSNIGRPSCQLWFNKNKPDEALPRPTTFVMNMMLGDIVEAVFKGVLRSADIPFDNSEHVTLKLDDLEISGTYDLVMNGAVDDVKSASDWSYRNKFTDYETLAHSDSFGYIGQLAGYARAAGKEAGGWWVINKANGSFKYIPASGLDIDEQLGKVKDTINKVNNNEFERCFSAVPEYFRGKATGNFTLPSECTFCDYRHLCWETLEERPAIMSQAKDPKTVGYVYIANEGDNNARGR